MPDEPPVLRRLKALGLSQKDLAFKLGASPAAVSMWCAGKRPFDEPYLTEAQVLLAVMMEHLEHGGTPQTVSFRPTVFLNPGGTTHGGDSPMSPEAMAEFPKFLAAIQGLSPERQVAAHDKFAARMIMRMLPDYADYDPLMWNPSAHQLEEIRKIVKALDLAIVGLLQRKAHAAMTKENPHADEVS